MAANWADTEVGGKEPLPLVAARKNGAGGERISGSLVANALAIRVVTNALAIRVVANALAIRVPYRAVTEGSGVSLKLASGNLRGDRRQLVLH
jgi:hypothetical protein